MEDRRVLIIALIVLVCVPLQVTAYLNTNAGGHPSINRYAVDYFEKNLLPSDSLLKNTSIRGEPCWGLAWDELDGKADTGPRDTISIPRSKLLQNWIRDGGYSADEPEYSMALVHFYDPKNPGKEYLTDHLFLQKVGELWYSDLVNPRLSAVDWAFDSDTGTGYYIQDYSWNDGLRYYKAALESPLRSNFLYGQAWRAVGETMHLMSDMTVPAHVRNDGHPSSEPYENSVGAWEVTHYKNGPFLNLDYDHGTLKDVMIRVATKVNEEFYSADTTPVRYETVMGHTYTSYSYPQPSLEGLVPDANGYYYSDGRALAREDTALFQPALSAGVLRYVYRLDKKVLDDQRKVLIPTAIRASAEVLDRFLPRFEAKLSIKKYLPEAPEDEQYEVYTTLKQVHSEPDAWSGHDLIVRNGAYLVEITPDGKKTEIPLSLTPTFATPPPDPNFNRWQDLFKFKPGTRVYMKYDLGGYVITSNEVQIPTLTPTPTPTTTATTEPSTIPTTAQPIPKASWGCVNTAACTPEHPELCCPGTTFDTGPCAGCEKCCVWVNQTNMVTGEQGYFAIRAFCSCETGEDVDRSSINTNPWSSLPG